MSSPYQNPFDSTAGKPNPYASPGYQPYGTQPYGMPQSGYYKPHRAGVVLTLGIISIVLSTVGFALCGLFPVVGLALAIPAWVMGMADLKAMNRGEMDPLGRGATTAGMVTGIIGTIIGALMALIIVGFIVFFIVMMIIGAANGGMR